MRLWFALAVSIAAMVPWLLLFRRSADAPRSQAESMALALPAAAILVAILAPSPVHLTSQGAVTLGILLTLIAVGLVQSRFLPGYSGYAHSLWAYALYGIAFVLAAPGLRLTPWLLIPLAVAALLAYLLYNRLGELWGTIMLAGGLLFLVAWASLSDVVGGPTPFNIAGLVGVTFLIGFHTLQIVSTYAPLRPGWPNPAIAYSLPAHLLIAWSVWS